MKHEWHRILVVVEDEARADLDAVLAERGWQLEYTDDVQQIHEAMNQSHYACAIVEDGPDSPRLRDVLTRFEKGPTAPVIGLVRAHDVSTAVDAMKLGAHQVIEAGRDGWVESVVAAIEEAIPKGAGPVKGDPRDLVLRGENSPFDKILEVLPPMASSDASVLLTGESGTGKELVARIIHAMSDRADGPFVAVNAAAIPDTLLESELFGHVEGAFTGAQADREGKIVSAHGGTLLLDEVGEMPLQLQVKLLRVLQEKKVTPVGSTRPIAVDFRVIAATNRNLEHEIVAENFREDLYYRLSVLPLHLPPLRERRNDIPVMAEHFLNEQNQINGTQLQGITRETLSAIKKYHWPGNVRELQNLIQRLSILKRIGFIEREDLPDHILGEQPTPQLGLYVPSEGMDMAQTLEVLESTLLKQALEKADGNKAQAARLLGLNRTTLVEKVKRMRIEEEMES